MDANYYWANDPYWTEALDKYCELKDKGKRQIVIDLEKLTQVVYDGDGPAYKLLDAMASVNALEGEDGHKGASRVLLAMLVRLEELSEAKKKRPSRQSNPN